MVDRCACSLARKRPNLSISGLCGGEGMTISSASKKMRSYGAHLLRPLALIIGQVSLWSRLGE